MNLERGLRRITLTISLAALIAGLLVTGYDTYRIVQHVSAMQEYGACLREAESFPDKPDKACNLMDRNSKELGCYYILNNSAANRLWPTHLGYVLQFTIVWAPSLATNGEYELYTMALLPLIIGVLLSTGLAAIPWGVFYLVRWIVYGFKV